jgi:hypothetical protein
MATLAIVFTVVVAIVVSGSPPNAAPPHVAESPSQSPSPSPSRPAPSPAPTATVRCVEEPEPLAAGLTGPACPSAILAVELAVAPVRLPIERISVEPGPFYCDLLWPGAQTAPPCVGYATRPGQFMHAWVGFAGSSEVAVVMLGLNLPADDTPGATRPPWHMTLVAVEIPPDGWVMP